MSTETPPTIKTGHIVLIAVAAFALLCIWMWPRMTRDTVPAAPEDIAPAAQVEPQEVAESTPEPVAAPTPAAAPAEPMVPAPAPLPSLNNSDNALENELQEAPYSAISALVTNEYYIRKVVRAAVAASGGQLVNQHRPLVPPQGVFTATEQDSKLTISEANYARYTPYIEALENIGSDNMAALYIKYLPLLQQAYEELGLKDKNFHEVTLEALDAIASAPQDSDAELIRPSVMYQFKDKTLEDLPAVQKLLLRMGQENQRRLKIILESFRASIK